VRPVHLVAFLFEGTFEEKSTALIGVRGKRGKLKNRKTHYLKTK
jgi:hypothetical protein